MLVQINSAAIRGVDAIPILIEVDVGKGAQYSMVGLPGSAVRESWQRMETAIKHAGFRMPRLRITINLAPADLPKSGACFDLPMAVGILAASGQIPKTPFESSLLLGELALDGKLRPIRGALSVAMMAKQQGIGKLLLPTDNGQEAAMIEGLEVIGLNNLNQLKFFSRDAHTLKVVPTDISKLLNQAPSGCKDFSDVKGQQQAKRALEIAAAGGHNLLMTGPPGSGKSMLAKRLPSILPPLTIEESLEATRIHSVAGLLPLDKPLLTQRPFRAPHYSATQTSLAGGGTRAFPGEISLAHKGVLFLDELPEFRGSILEILRQPMEDHYVNIARANYRVNFPAQFMLIAAMNPCRCGNFGSTSGHPCVCSPHLVKQYQSRISGPLLDRIDLQIQVSPVRVEELSSKSIAESSAEIRARVIKAREMQLERFSNEAEIQCNAQMKQKQLINYCPLNSEASNLLNRAINQLHLSARSYDRLIKVARSIADLEAKNEIESADVAEALQYRSPICNQ